MTAFAVLIWDLDLASTRSIVHPCYLGHFFFSPLHLKTPKVAELKTIAINVQLQVPPGVHGRALPLTAWLSTLQASAGKLERQEQ